MNNKQLLLIPALLMCALLLPALAQANHTVDQNNIYLPYGMQIAEGILVEGDFRSLQELDEGDVVIVDDDTQEEIDIRVFIQAHDFNRLNIRAQYVTGTTSTQIELYNYTAQTFQSIESQGSTGRDFFSRVYNLEGMNTSDFVATHNGVPDTVQVRFNKLEGGTGGDQIVLDYVTLSNYVVFDEFEGIGALGGGFNLSETADMLLYIFATMVLIFVAFTINAHIPAVILLLGGMLLVSGGSPFFAWFMWVILGMIFGLGVHDNPQDTR